ncbi:MAG: hypothetical protein ACE5GW_10325, partial [Planctomycetota bacterium]
MAWRALAAAAPAAPARADRDRRGGSALLVVLWAMVLLGMVVVSVLHTSRLEVRVSKNYGDQVQARYLALAGVEKAKALLYTELEEQQAGGSLLLDAILDNPAELRAVELGRGEFSVFRQAREDEGRGLIYGISDEAARLSVNHAPLGELIELPGMTEEIAAAIVDWRDPDSRVSPQGAEEEDYLGAR